MAEYRGLLPHWLLYRAGFEIGKYISLEAKIAKNKDAYYAVLENSQVGWHEQQDDPTAFVKFLLSMIIAAYRNFDDRIQIISSTSFDTVKKAIENKLGKFTKKDILELCPSLSASTVERHLRRMVMEGELKKLGGGRTTMYVKTVDL